METLTVTEAKASLSRILQRVLDGETIAIGRRGRPEIILRRYDGADDVPRQLGGWQGEYWMADDFDAASPELEAMFAGEHGGP